MSFSRRTFLKRAGTAAVATAAATTLQPLNRLWGAPSLIQANGTLTIGVNAEVPTLDPANTPGSIVGLRWLTFLFDSLVGQDVDAKPIPRLATDWTMDGTTWVFTLRPDVKFHDGSVMTANDVVYSLNRVLNKIPNLTPSAQSLQFTPYIDSVEATGDLEVTITTVKPDPVLPLRLTAVQASITPEGYEERFGFEAIQTQPLGAGPYKLVSYTPGDRMVLEPHTEYWGGVAAASQVTVRIIPENATRIAALQTGEVDLITTVPPDLADQVVTDTTRLDQVKVWNFLVMMFNTVKGPTAKVGVRRALSLAIDRPGIISALWAGRTSEMNGYYLPEEIGYDPSRAPFAYDPEAAKRELEASGYAGEEIHFTPPSAYYTNGRLVSDAINEMWTAIGANINYEPMETSGWVDKVLAGDLIASIGSYGSNGDPATSSISSAWLPGSNLALLYPGPEDFLQLAEDGASTTDVATRETIYREMAAILDRDIPITPLYRSVEFYGVRNNITWEPHPNFLIDLRPGKFSL